MAKKKQTETTDRVDNMAEVAASAPTDAKPAPAAPETPPAPDEPRIDNYAEAHQASAADWLARQAQETREGQALLGALAANDPASATVSPHEIGHRPVSRGLTNVAPANGTPKHRSFYMVVSLDEEGACEDVLAVCKSRRRAEAWMEDNRRLIRRSHLKAVVVRAKRVL
jgi:hypothetical protein